MKQMLFLVFILALSLGMSAQSKKELGSRLDNLESKVVLLTAEVKSLSEQNKALKADIEILKSKGVAGESKTSSSANPPKTGETKQCKAITAAGTQCSRNADANSDYCWQHAKSNTTSGTSESKSSYNGSQNIQTGPRGGKYYINSNGKKTYIKR